RGGAALHARPRAWRRGRFDGQRLIGSASRNASIREPSYFAKWTSAPVGIDARFEITSSARREPRRLILVAPLRIELRTGRVLIQWTQFMLLSHTRLG